MAAYVRDCARRLEPATVTRYARQLDGYVRWLEATEPRRRARPMVDAVSRDHLERYWDHLRSTPATSGRGTMKRGRATSTLCKMIGDLTAWWEWAYDQDDRWPGQVPRPRKIAMPKPRRTAPVAPTWAEMDACVWACEGWSRQVAVILRYTGLRVGQAVRLTWDDVDLDAAVLTVRPELGKTGAEKAGRVIPVSRHLAKELAGWGRREGWVVDAPDRRPEVLRCRALRRAWRRSGARPALWAGDPAHTFRDGFVTGLAALGADREAVEHLVGHAVHGVRSAYLDPTAGLALRAAVELVPAIGPAVARIGVAKEGAP